MYPTIYEYHGLGFHTWGLMVMLAFLAGALYVSSRAGKVGIDPDKLVPLYLLSIIAGLGGARLLHFAFAEPRVLLEHPLAYFDINQGGFAFYGGVIAGILFGALYLWIRKINVWKMADIAAPAIILGLAVGRIGCFSAGCCHGARCGHAVTHTLLNLPGGSVVTVDGGPGLALIFKAGVGVGAIHGVPVYPTQIWASLAAFLLFAALAWMQARLRRFDGQVMAVMLVVYAMVRSTIESYRGDTIRGVFDLGFVQASTSQIVSAVMVLAAVVVVLLRARKGVAPEVPIVVEPMDE